LFIIFIAKWVTVPPYIAKIILFKNKFECVMSSVGSKKTNEQAAPIQKPEHSMQSSIFLKKEGNFFATIFLIGIKISDSDHSALIPHETKRKHIKFVIQVII
jgi:hypothetical protein